MGAHLLRLPGIEASLEVVGKKLVRRILAILLFPFGHQDRLLSEPES
jgi:hypothetical protein